MEAIKIDIDIKLQCILYALVYKKRFKARGNAIWTRSQNEDQNAPIAANHHATNSDT